MRVVVTAAAIAAVAIGQSSTPAKALRYVPGSSVKIAQLIGDEDKQRHQPTATHTLTRFGVEGTDLGNSFEHNGRAYFLFGDTLGTPGNVRDTIAFTDSRDPEAGVALEFLMAAPARILTIAPKGLRMGAFEVPVGGISLNNQMYVVVSTDHSDDRTTDRSVLTKFAAPATFAPMRTMSQLPAGHFVKMSMHAQGPDVFLWGTGAYRKSDAYLARVPATQFESGSGTRYLTGLDANGAPKWSEQEADATPIVKSGVMGDLSVTWAAEAGLWIMTWDSRPPMARGIHFAYSTTPWGPWSEPQLIFDPTRDGGLGKFIHNPRQRPPDDVAGPVIGRGSDNPAGVIGGGYAPYVVERWTKRIGSQLRIYFVLSTWNPYVVVLMRSTFEIS